MTRQTPLTQHNGSTKNRFNQAQRGVALMTMIFILVVMGSAVTFMARLSLTQNSATSQAVLASRAKYAAMSGIFWMAYQLNWNTESTGDASDATDGDSACTSSDDEVINNLAGDLSGFTVTVNCDSSQYTEGSNTIYIFNVTSTAEFGSLGDDNYAYKQVTVVMERQE